MYTIIEMQTNDGITVLTPPVTKQDRNEAEQVFHQVLSYAAVSQVQIHTVVILNAEGAVVKKECYKHGTNTEV